MPPALPDLLAERGFASFDDLFEVLGGTDEAARMLGENPEWVRSVRQGDKPLPAWALKRVLEHLRRTDAKSLTDTMKPPRGMD